MSLRERIAFSIAAMEPSIQGAAYQQGFFDAKAEALRRAESVTLDERSQFANPERMASCGATTLSFNELDGVPELPKLDGPDPLFSCACSITVVNGGHPWTDASKCPVHKQQAESANARY